MFFEVNSKLSTNSTYFPGNIAGFLYSYVEGSYVDRDIYNVLHKGRLNMLQMAINVIFLLLILIPVFIFFLALYQNLLIISKPRQNTNQRRVKAETYCKRTEEESPTKLRVAK